MADYSFEMAIKKHLDEVAKKDKLFAKNYAKKNKSISECVNYIIGEARKRAHSGVAAISDEETYCLAIHYYDEDDIKVNVKDAMGGVTVAHGEVLPTLKKKQKAKAETKVVSIKSEPESEDEPEDEGLNIPLFD